MRQVKLFKGIEAEIKALESEVNSWIEQNSIHVVGITGTISPQSQSTPGLERMSGSDILMIVEYEKQEDRRHGE